MTFTIKPAYRENVPRMIGFGGPSHSGKTFSLLRLLHGLCGGSWGEPAPDKFIVIDTENNRAKEYAPKPGEEPNFKGTWAFDHLAIDAPFTAGRYLEACKQAEKAGYAAIGIDSMTHLWSGDGGGLEEKDEVQGEIAKRIVKSSGGKTKDWKAREIASDLAWARVKPPIKRLKYHLQAMPCHLVLCYRAEEKTKRGKDSDGKQTREDIGYQPIGPKEISPYEMTGFMMFNLENPGVPSPLFPLREHMKPIFGQGRQVNEEMGRKLAQWAAGVSSKPKVDGRSEKSTPPPVDDGDPRSIAQRIKEEFVESGELTKDEVGMVLRSAKLDSKTKLENARWQDVKALLAIAANKRKGT